MYVCLYACMYIYCVTGPSPRRVYSAHCSSIDTKHLQLREVSGSELAASAHITFWVPSDFYTHVFAMHPCNTSTPHSQIQHNYSKTFAFSAPRYSSIQGNRNRQKENADWNLDVRPDVWVKSKETLCTPRNIA